MVIGAVFVHIPNLLAGIESLLSGIHSLLAGIRKCKQKIVHYNLKHCANAPQRGVIKQLRFRTHGRRLQGMLAGIRACYLEFRDCSNIELGYILILSGT